MCSDQLEGRRVIVGPSQWVGSVGSESTSMSMLASVFGPRNGNGQHKLASRNLLAHSACSIPILMEYRDVYE